MKITEENYITLMQHGNENALKYFIDHHGWIVKSIIHKKMAAYINEQEECMNDVFFAIWENVNKYDSTKAAFTTWVASVTRYKVLNHIRSLQRTARLDSIDDLEIIGEEDIPMEGCDERQDFQKLIACLSKQDQELFVRLFYEEQTKDEICETTGIKKDVLYNRISRGKQKIRRNMQEGVL
jgi:RNA polymerase sigma-70 factor (ECF subfamily)